MRRLAVCTGLVALLAVAGCATRILGGVYTEDGGEDDGGTTSNPDLTSHPTVDLALPPAPDLAPPGKDCGQIILCIIQCGGMIQQCAPMCFQGASPDGAREAAQLLQCAAQNCSGGGNVMQCVGQFCSMQLQQCQGLGGG